VYLARPRTGQADWQAFLQEEAIKSDIQVFSFVVATRASFPRKKETDDGLIVLHIITLARLEQDNCFGTGDVLRIAG